MKIFIVAFGNIGEGIENKLVTTNPLQAVQYAEGYNNSGSQFPKWDFGGIEVWEEGMRLNTIQLNRGKRVDQFKFTVKTS